jgi:hypothetical protein
MTMGKEDKGQATVKMEVVDEALLSSQEEEELRALISELLSPRASQDPSEGE